MKLMSRTRRKKILGNPIVTNTLCGLFAFYIRMVSFTSKQVVEIPDSVKPILAGEEACICAFWHGRMFLMPLFKPKNRKMFVLSSSHRDGVLIARVNESFDIRTIKGSSSRGSLSALRNIMRTLNRGDNISLTPDGPRGPQRGAAVGIVYAAQMSGVRIVPVSFSATKATFLKSWDRFCIPYPFTRLFLVIGEPISIPRDIDNDMLESYRKQVEDTLNHLTDRADKLADQIPSERVAA